MPASHTLGADTPVSLRLRLYFGGDGPNSVSAIANLKAVLADQPRLVVNLELIDVLKDPERALRDGILVTPMLVKLEPLPERRILGNLRDRTVLLQILSSVAGTEC